MARVMRALFSLVMLVQVSRQSTRACGRKRASGAERLAVQRFASQQRAATELQAQVSPAGTSASEAAPIRIHAEYQTEGLDTARSRFLQQILIPSAVEELRRRLLVRRPVQGNLTLGRSCEVLIPDVWGGMDDVYDAPGPQQDADELWNNDGPYGGTSELDWELYSDGDEEHEDASECNPSSQERYCSDSETGVIHNPDFLGPWQGLPGGPGAPDTDFILYVATREVADCWQGTLAYAGACEMDRATSRPLAGYINICPAALTLDRDRLDKSVDELLETVVHEMLHVLFFSDNLFPLFIGADGQRRAEVVREVDGSSEGYGRHMIVAPEVIEAAASHFGCTSIDGVELSNDELPPGNHWEDRLYMGEIMDSARRVRASSDHSVFSSLTLALAEASGWYLRNPATAEASLPFGRRAGCRALSSSETCKKQTFGARDVDDGSDGLYCSIIGRQACSYDHLAVGHCAVEGFMDGCAVVLPLSASSDCRDTKFHQAFVPGYRGPGGRCMTLQEDGVNGGPSDQDASRHAECFKSRCDSGLLFVEVGSSEYSCPTERSINVEGVDGREFVIGPCPDNQRLCDSLGCEGDCSGNGNCVSGVCQCYLGWEGSACENRIEELRIFAQARSPTTAANTDEDGEAIGGTLPSSSSALDRTSLRLGAWRGVLMSVGFAMMLWAA